MTMKHAIDPAELDAAMQVAQGSVEDVKAITKVLPGVLEQPNPTAAFDLVCAAGQNKDSWLPEALTLFGTAGLSPIQLREMAAHVFTPKTYLDAPMMDKLARCNARLGKYGFSFPQWRYLSQGVDGISLVERYGMHRLRRENDVRDPAAHDPDRDLFGAGFISNENSHYIEYRRSYIVCADLSEQNPATVIIRNNSYFYGRDRLPAPVLVSYEPISANDLENLSPVDFDSGKFIRWQDITESSQHIPLSVKVDRAERLLNSLDDFDGRLMAWVFSAEPDGGFPHLLDLFRSKLATNGPPIFIGKSDPEMPPWYPKSALPVTVELWDQLTLSQSDPTGAPPRIQELFKPEPNSRLTLFTGQNGDLPLRPKPLMQYSAMPLPGAGS